MLAAVPDPSDLRQGPDESARQHAERRWVPVVVVGLFLVAVVLVASATSPARQGDSTATDLVVVGLAALVAAAAVGLAVTAWLRRRPTNGPTAVDDTDSALRILRRQRLVATAITVILLGLLVGAVASYLERNAPPRTEVRPQTTGTTLPERTRLADAGGTTSGTWRLLLAAGLAVGAVGAAVVAMRSRAAAGRGTGEADTSVAAAIDAAIADLDDLGDDADNRRVVIRCYARMERAAALGGVPTSAADTPRDLVARIVAGTSADPAACRRLGELFERARFSTHPVDDSMRAEAADTLRTIRAALLAPATGAAVAPVGSSS